MFGRGAGLEAFNNTTNAWRILQGPEPGPLPYLGEVVWHLCAVKASTAVLVPGCCSQYLESGSSMHHVPWEREDEGMREGTVFVGVSLFAVRVPWLEKRIDADKV